MGGISLEASSSVIALISLNACLFALVAYGKSTAVASIALTGAQVNRFYSAEPSTDYWLHGHPLYLVRAFVHIAMRI